MKIKYIPIVLCLGLLKIDIFGHEVIVHQAITVNAAESAYAHSPAYAGFINVIISDRSLTQETNLMRIGSGEEDDNAKQDPVGGYRSLNHFYDPLDNAYGKGLSDSPGGSLLVLLTAPVYFPLTINGDTRILMGTNSFAWASISNCAGINIPVINPHPTNTWSWQNVRYFEWCGLTATIQSNRQINLDNMFRGVGQVIHLLEDTTQPQHVRNEQHLDKYPFTSIATIWHSPIEKYGLDNVTNLNYGDGSMLNWQAAGFTKLEDFWDRQLYNGNVTALDEAENGGAQLGLAEWCNGNFLGDRHSYAEYFPEENSDGTPNIMWYPYPSLFTGTPYLQHGAYVDSVTLKNGNVVNRYYLPKTGDGIQVNHFSTVSWFGAKFPNKIFRAATSIRDDNVLKDYHYAFIPKAVKYSAGLLDYFFRGTMNVSIIGTNALQITNLIVNTSSQPFSGGQFHLFYDDINGVRTEITNFINGYTGMLATNDSFMAVFTQITNITVTHYLYVYQGNVGTTDPVDANIAIAVQNFMTPKPFDCGNKKITSTAFDAWSAQPSLNGTQYVFITGDVTNDAVVVFGDPYAPNGWAFILGRWLYIDGFFSERYPYVDSCTGASGPDNFIGEVPVYSEVGSDEYTAWDGSMPFEQVSDNECDFSLPCVGIVGGGSVNGSLELSAGTYILTINAGGQILWQGTSLTELGTYNRIGGTSLNPPSLVLIDQ
jgi:hypothetical protein